MKEQLCVQDYLDRYQVFSGIIPVRLVSIGFCFNYSKPSVPSFTSVDPTGLGSTGSFLVVPLTHNRTELSQTERVGSGIAVFQVKFEQTFESQ